MNDDTAKRPGRLTRVDARADAMATAILGGLWKLAILAGALLGVAIALYIGLWALDLLSWGSELEDYVPWMEVDVSPNKPADCPSTELRDAAGKSFYVGVQGCKP